MPLNFEIYEGVHRLGLGGVVTVFSFNEFDLVVISIIFCFSQIN